MRKSKFPFRRRNTVILALIIGAVLGALKLSTVLPPYAYTYPQRQFLLGFGQGLLLPVEVAALLPGLFDYGYFSRVRPFVNDSEYFIHPLYVLCFVVYVILLALLGRWLWMRRVIGRVVLGVTISAALLLGLLNGIERTSQLGPLRQCQRGISDGQLIRIAGYPAAASGYYDLFVLSSTDHQQSWTQIYYGKGLDPDVDCDRLIQRYGEQTAWMVFNRYVLLFTHDGGGTWYVWEDSGSYAIDRVLFEDDSRGMIFLVDDHPEFGGSSAWLSTTDGGFTWQWHWPDEG